MSDTISLTTLELIGKGYVTTGSLGIRDSWLFDPQPPSPPPPAPNEGEWDYLRAHVDNATNTYWSYGARLGAVRFDKNNKNDEDDEDDKDDKCRWTDKDKKALHDRMRLYLPQPDGQLRWAAFQQLTPSPVAAKSNLKKMVEDVGGNPADFKSKLAMAKYIIAREAPRGVKREEDDGEVFSGRTLVYRGQPASQKFWGVGQLGNGTLTMAATTQGAMEKYGK